MSDPSHDGPYTCHGLMEPITLPAIADETGAYLCRQCGKYRHAFRRSDPRRAQVNAAMPALIAALALEGV